MERRGINVQSASIYTQMHPRQELPTSALNLEALRHGLFTHLHQHPYLLTYSMEQSPS